MAKRQVFVRTEQKTEYTFNEEELIALLCRAIKVKPSDAEVEFNVSQGCLCDVKVTVTTCDVKSGEVEADI